MKKILLIFTLALFTTTVWAQENTTPAKRPSWQGFETNKFWDNWEISVGGGVGTAFSNGPDFGKQSKRLGWEANVSFTKWQHPVYGVRLQLQGGKFSNFFADGTKAKWPYVFLHTDLMLNFSNWVGGYRDDRAYYLVPFAGFGYMATNITDNSQRNSGIGFHHGFAFSMGLLNKFRISHSFDFNIELKTLLAPSRIAPVDMGGAYMFGMSATAGFTYRFNQRTFERGLAGYTMDDIIAFQNAVAAEQAANAALNAKNKALADEAAAAQAKADQLAKDLAAAKAVKPTVAPATPTAMILYDINASKLTAKDKTRLQLQAELIKNGPSDKVYEIVGSADKQTGTATYNQKLSEKRAKAVYDYLVAQGVNKDQLKCNAIGGTDAIDIQNANRAVTIK